MKNTTNTTNTTMKNTTNTTNTITSVRFDFNRKTFVYQLSIDFNLNELQLQLNETYCHRTMNNEFNEFKASNCALVTKIDLVNKLIDEKIAEINEKLNTELVEVNQHQRKINLDTSLDFDFKI